MSWRKIPMKFSGVCIVCKKKIEINEIGYWAKGLGVKHIECAEVYDLQCLVCGGSTGCSKCEFKDYCVPSTVSPFCICSKCRDKNDSFTTYQQAVGERFPILNLKN